MNIVLLGPPGAGKGTQGERLSKECGVPRYATGDIFREAVREGTPLGRQAEGYMQRGELVPDAVVLGLIREALATPAAQRGFILDGFPRTLAQAEGLRGLLGEQGRQLDVVVHFEVPEDELVRRLSGRRTCQGCGRVYSVDPAEPDGERVCGRCGGELRVRDDDRPETVRKRLQVYEEQTEPLLQWYRDSSVGLEKLDGTGSVEEVHDKLLNLVDCR